jgi:hypothetical protein
VNPLFTRRAVVLSAPALAMPGFASARTPDDATGRLESRFIEFRSEREAFQAHFRLERDLVDRGEVLTWYHWIAFAIPQGGRPVQVVRYEGIEYSYFRKIGDLTWRIHAHNLSFPRDLRTGRFIDRVRNPLTGEDVTVPVTVLVEDPGVLYSPRGYLPLDSRSGEYLPSDKRFRIEGEFVVIDHVRAAPESWPATFIEASTSWVSRRDFDNPSVTSLPATLSGVYVFPFPGWLRMGEQKGHMLGSIAGRKLKSVNKIPTEFYARAAREHPELLKPRWHELDKPLTVPVSARES